MSIEINEQSQSRWYLWDKTLGCMVEISAADSRLPAPRKLQHQREGFIGRIPLAWAQKSCQLPGKAAALTMCLWYLHGLTKKTTIKLTKANRAAFGLLNRNTYYHAVTALETAGLIRIVRRQGQSLTVQLVGLAEPEPEPSNGGAAGPDVTGKRRTVVNLAANREKRR